MKIAAIWLFVAAALLAASSVQMSADAQWYDTEQESGPLGPLECVNERLCGFLLSH